jgi:ABC-type phosphate transport system substrate-binding protein
MWRTAHALLLVGCAALCWSASSEAQTSRRVTLIVNLARAAEVTPADVRAIYLKQKRFWRDGRSIIPINREAGSASRELFSERLFGQSSRRLASYWNQRYFEAGEFPPATLASEAAVVRFVSENRDAIGYVAGDTADESVAAVLVLD